MSARILVAGNINVETTLHVAQFPIEYTSLNQATFGISSQVSGVSYNVARALQTLGDEVRLAALTANDILSQAVQSQLRSDGFAATFLSPQLSQTPQSVVIYDRNGQRQTNTDLKNLQEQSYPETLFEQALEGCTLFIPGNVNFARPMLLRARAAQIPIATDLQVIDRLDNEYNQAFMQAAQILFMSNDKLTIAPEEMARQLLDKYGVEIIGIGLGAQGVLLAVRRDHFLERIPAVVTRPVVNTSGAGDALFAAFNHFYHHTSDPYTSISKALAFASYKIGESGSASGFLTETELKKWL